MKNKNAILILEDGSFYRANHFGANKSSFGEVVFNTAMTGYTESLTDPSYKNQILIYTYPIIGNYGIPYSSMNIDSPLESLYESNKIHINGLIICNYTNKPNHWNMNKTLSKWLEENNIPGIYGIDTRNLTKKLRKNGTMLGKIIINEKENTKINNYIKNKSYKVSIKNKKIYGNGLYKIILIDCGVKNNIIRCLLKRNCTVIRVPWNYNFINDHYDGVFISNGPGDPKFYKDTINNINYILKDDKPIFGICLGNQILGLAAGADTYKLKYGHRGHNQPVILNNSNKAFITSQNHGYAIKNINKLFPNWKILFKNLNDNSCEGLIHNKKPFFSVQFHPEASGGPIDTEFLFDKFIDFIKKNKK